MIEPVDRERARIGILTFHRCINYGSYWQARSLVMGLRRRGHDAVLLDHRCPKAQRAEWRCAFQPLLPRRSPRSDFAHYAIKARRLIDAADALPNSAPFALEAPELSDEYGLVIVGSDEVWNIQHPWYGGRTAFYGEGLRARRIVSYAASFGSQDAAGGLHPAWSARLRRFEAISVRDRNSRQMVRDGLAIEPTIVLDPVLQFPPEMPPAPAPGAAREPYLAVYGHSFPAWYAAAVRAHARAAGLRLVSVGYRNDWADEQRIDASPAEFAALIAHAASVATNFFHGCVFALAYQRPFACVTSAYRANKLGDLAAAVGAEERLVGSEQDAEARMADLLSRPLDPAVAERIAALRAQSDAFLARVLA